MPAKSGTPLARWTCPELARKAAADGIVPAPSPSMVRRWLAADAIKPWQHRSWIFPRDPRFALKASRVLDLYQREWEGQPYASAKRVFWVAGNGASHRNWAAAARLSDAYPNAQMARLPVHASWLNQVEACVSVIQRKLLTPGDFEDLDELAAQILAFEKHYNAAARPFDWKFTRTDLNKLLARIRQHDQHSPQPMAA